MYEYSIEFICKNKDQGVKPIVMVFSDNSLLEVYRQRDKWIEENPEWIPTVRTKLKKILA